MTIEQLQSEKRVLKEKIEKAVNEFHQATGLQASGEFKTKELTLPENPFSPKPPQFVAKATINPIEI